MIPATRTTAQEGIGAGRFLLAKTALLLFCGVAACSGSALYGLRTTSATPDQEDAAAPGPAPAGHGDELIPGLSGAGMMRDTSAKEALPQDREGLLRAGRDALADHRTSDALSIAEVLLLVHGADDAEAREFRGECLEALGDEDAALEEFEACCTSGRGSCCRAAEGR